MRRNLDFREIWLVDFGFTKVDGELPEPTCLVALELFSCREERFCRSALLDLAQPPYPIDDQSLFVTFAGVAKLCCHIALKWQLPSAILDLHAEFCLLTNGQIEANDANLLSASKKFGICSFEAGLKEQLRTLRMNRAVHAEEDPRLLEEYCASDVKTLASLLLCMKPMIDMPRALIRGRYIRALAQVEARGVPIDTEVLARFKLYWPQLRPALIAEAESAIGFYQWGQLLLNSIRILATGERDFLAEARVWSSEAR